jgi:uncharacterized protein (DUF2342 family)
VVLVARAREQLVLARKPIRVLVLAREAAHGHEFHHLHVLILELLGHRLELAVQDAHGDRTAHEHAVDGARVRLLLPLLGRRRTSLEVHVRSLKQRRGRSHR